MKPGDLVIYNDKQHWGTCTVPQPVIVLETLEIDGEPASFRGLNSKGGIVHWECRGWKVIQ